MHTLINRLLIALVGLAWFAPAALACPVCFGDPDSPLASGVNWGIFLLLAITGGVLAGFVSFFVYLFKRSRATSRQPLDVPHRVRQEGSY